MLALAAAIALGPSLAVADRLPTQPYSRFYSPKARLPQPEALCKLPTGTIEARGWLKLQLDLERKGFSGQLEQISRYLKFDDNAWAGTAKQGRAGWEELPYWLRGQASLAYVTKDPVLIKQVEKWLEPVLSSPSENGWLGPEGNLKTKLGTPDVWPNALMMYAMQTHYEATRDKRVLSVIGRYVHFLLSLPKEQLLDQRHYWHYYRTADQIANLIWYYQQTGDTDALKLATDFHKAGASWMGDVPNRHGVNFGQGFREPATHSLISQNPREWKATESVLAQYRNEFSMGPGGMYAADENARPGKNDPRQACESCAVVEMMLSHELLLEYSGDTRWADEAEDTAYNWLPATMTPDLKALRYLQGANTAVSDAGSKSPGVENGGPMFLMDPNDHRCCQHNVGMGWPYFTERLWFATAGDGLFAAIYAPSSVRAKVGSGTQVTVDEQTSYPFEPKVTFAVSPDRPTAFPLSFRVPQRCPLQEVRLNGARQRVSAKPGQVVTVSRTWKKGDRLEVTFAFPTRVEQAKHAGAVSVYSGPLAFSLKIAERYQKVPRPNGWDASEIYPESPWNYGLPANPTLTVHRQPLKPGVQPFSQAGCPVSITTKAARIPEWTTDMYGLTATLQSCPAYTAEPLETKELIPMGAARLRISVFPTVSSSPTANKWKPSRQARKPLPTTYSFRAWFDSEAAPSDGLLPEKPGDEDVPRFTWWDHKGTREWLQYTLPQPKTFSRSRVYWFDDTGHGGCRLPESWTLQVKVDGEWQDVKLTSPVTTVKDGWSVASFESVTASEVRLTAQLKSGFSSGVVEWELGAP